MKIKARSHDTISSIEFVESSLKIEYNYSTSIQYIDYKDIQKINIHVQVAKGTTNKGGTYYYIDNIILVISYSSNEELILMANGNLRVLYEIINHKKCCQDFKLSVIGNRHFDMQLKIYSKFGIKLPIGYNIALNNVCLLFTMGSIYSAYEFGLFNNNLDFLDINSTLFFVLILLMPSLIFSGIAVYQEYLKYRIRKVLSL